MGRLSVVLGFTLSLILCLAAIPAAAEEVIEAWRGGGFQQPGSVPTAPAGCQWQGLTVSVGSSTWPRTGVSSCTSTGSGGHSP